MHVMAKAGLGDVYRKLNGRKSAGFTRECNTVRTRIDRIYATEFSSDTVWHRHELDAKYAKNIRTDHTAVVAEMSALGASRSRPEATRINKELLKEDEMFQRMKDIWYNIEDKYKKVSPNPAITKWEEFKEQAYATLMAETKLRKKVAKAENHNPEIAALERELHYLQTSGAFPTRIRAQDTRRVKEELREVVAKFKPAGPRTSHRRFQREEQSTKEFYKQFRATHANMNINEMNVTDDWDHPLEGQTTTDPEEITG